MKAQLFLKFIGGPRIGLLQANREPLTGDLEKLVGQILRALRSAGTPTTRDALHLLLRRFDAACPFMDGIFVGPDVRGYFLYAPADMRPAEVEGFLIANLNLVPFFQTQVDGDITRLFSESVLPIFPELPEATISRWSAATGASVLGKPAELTPL